MKKMLYLLLILGMTMVLHSEVLTLDNILLDKEFGYTEEEILDKARKRGVSIERKREILLQLRQAKFSNNFIRSILEIARKQTKLPSLPERLTKGRAQRRNSQVPLYIKKSWAVVIGINDYKNDDYFRDLRYAVSDAEMFVKYLLELGVPKEQIVLLTNAQATKKNMEESLLEVEKRAGTGGTFYFYFSGHGGPDKKNKLYFLTHDTEADRAETTAYAMEKLKKYLKEKIKAQRVIAFLDACHSGGAKNAGMSKKSMIKTGRMNKTMHSKMAAIVRMPKELAIFTSSQANQESLEDSNEGHGLFTYYLIEGLRGKADRNRDKKVSLDEGFVYLMQKLVARTNGEQLPTRGFSATWDREFGLPAIEFGSVVKYEIKEVFSINKKNQRQKEFVQGKPIKAAISLWIQEISGKMRPTIEITGSKIESLQEELKQISKPVKIVKIFPLRLKESAPGEYRATLKISIGGISKKKDISFRILEAPQNDKFEPNQEKAQATRISPGMYRGLKIIKGDKDWYKVYMKENHKLKIKAYFSHAKGDLDIALYNEKSKKLSKGNSSSDNEEAEVKIINSGYYYIKVHGYQDASNEYDLEIKQEKSIENMPKGWPVSLWQECWKTTAEYVDFTNSSWTSLSWQEQFKYANSYQAWYSKYKNLKIEETINKSGIDFVFMLIPPGKFWMGSPSNEHKRDSDEVRHKVLISKPYYAGKYEVSQGQWEAVMGNNPSGFKNVGLNAPVERVSWNDCQKFCGKTGMRLLTEAEWEYACRGGTTSEFNIGNNISPNQVNYNGNYPYRGSKGKYRGKTVAVGSLPNKNSWQCYDFHGNVWEWCSDKFGDYPSTEQTNPAGFSYGLLFVVRGGSWGNDAQGCRSANRGRGSAGGRNDYLGLRLFLEAKN